jgi:lambda family phage tail tape measure protein
MANMIARLGVLLGLDSAEFNKGLADAGRKLEQFSNAAVTYGNIAATALTAASYAALKYADELADVAAANDIAISTVLKLSNALENSGGKAEDSAKLLASFTKFIDTAAQGSFEAQKHLAKMGVSLKDVGNLSTEELLYKVVKNIAAIEDPLTRSARGMEIFGKAAKGVDFVEVAERMSQTTKVTTEQAQAIKDAAEMHDLLAQNARNATLTLATELGPILKTTIGYIKDMTSDGNVLGETFKTVFQTIAISGANVMFVFQGINRQLQQTMLFVKAFLPGTDVEGQWSKYEKEGEIARQKLDEFERRIMGGGGGYGGGVSTFDDPRRLDKRKDTFVGRETVKAKDAEAEKAEKERLRIIRMINSERKALAKIELDNLQTQVAQFTSYANKNNEAKKAVDFAEQIFNIERANKDLRSEDIQLLKELATIENEREKTVYEIQRNSFLDADAKALLIQREQELADKSARLATMRNQALKADREGSFGQGMEKGIGKFFRDLPTDLENGQRAFESVVGNMEQALTNFTKTGKLSFKDLARSIIQDIIAIQLRAQASGLMGMLLRSVMGGWQGNAAMGTDVGGYTSSLAQFADGGDPPTNRASIVGERGPELFVPKTAGTIIPNHALSGMGGTTNVTNNYINAIDTKSFEQRLLGSSSAIWAANKYGEKNLASSFGRT